MLVPASAQIIRYTLRQGQATSVRRQCPPPALLSHPRRRLNSTLTTIKPAPDAPRQVPTPILFLAAKAFVTDGAQAKDIYASFVQHFASQGYESILLDLDPEQAKDKTTSHDLLHLYERDMAYLLRTASPFPPILFARHLSCLIAEQYASSHPLSSLLLLDPPLSSSRAHTDHPTLLPTPLKEYDFEPRFPCKVMWSSKEIDRQKVQAIPWYEVHRIEHAAEEEAGECLDRIVWEDVDEQGPLEVQKWLEDECGVSTSDVTSELLTSEHTVDSEEQDEEEEDDADGALLLPSSELSSRAASRSSSASGNSTGSGGTRNGRFLLPDLSLPEWFTSSSQYAFTSNRKMPLTLDESHLRESFNRGSGKGGQAINKNKSRCDLLHLPTGCIVRCQEDRTLARNRVLARRRISIMLEEGLKTAGLPSGQGQGQRDGVGSLSVMEKARQKEQKRRSNKKKKQNKKKREKAESSKEEESDEDQK